MIPAEETSGRILVEWLPSKYRTQLHLNHVDGKLILRLKKPSIGGYYYSYAFPLVDQIADTVLSPPTFSVGNRVHIDPEITIEECKTKQSDIGLSYSNNEMEQVYSI